MGEQERTSWLLVAALCLCLVAGAAFAFNNDQQLDHNYDDLQMGDSIVPPGWDHAVQNAKTFFGRAKSTDHSKEEEERQLGGSRDPSFRKSFDRSGGGYGASAGKGRKVGHPAASASVSEGCVGHPKAPINAIVRCSSFSGCFAQCLRNYQFPNGDRKILITCQNGEWKASSTDWDIIPDCQPSCLPECLNNGICVAPNQCNCPDTFTGPQCQFENKPCLSFPPAPKNSRRACTAMSCTIQCMENTKFPDGSGAANLICKSGVWVPNKPEWTSIPDCEPVCSPACENGGRCLSFNKCQCPTDFRGPQCQYSADRCDIKKMDFNGGRNCTGNSDTFSCLISCPPGIEFEFPPASVYTCSYSTGTYIPAPIPQCQYGENVIVKTHSASSSYSQRFSNSTWSKSQTFKKGGRATINTGMPIEDVLSKLHNFMTLSVNQKAYPGTCLFWGGNHFKSFDGKLFSFQSQCSYTLVRDAIDNTYTINLETDKNCGEKPCGRRLKIFVENKHFTLGLDSNGNPELTDQVGALVAIPSQISELSIQRVHNYVLIKLHAVGTSIKWDTKDYFIIDVVETLWNKTAGLCGKLDGSKANDFDLKDGGSAQTVSAFVNGWEMETFGERCATTPSDDHPCGDTSSAEVSIATQATEFCNKMLHDARFEPCRSLYDKLDTYSFFEACRWDYCLGKSEASQKEKACGSVSAFVNECLRLKVELPTSWRDAAFCPMKCENGTVYKQCGPAVQPSCRTAAVTDQQAEFCVEGCYCPEGLVRTKGTCIPKEQCPCLYGGKRFTNGATITKGCNTCKCTGGQWECTQVLCGARCSAIGDPHYVTFDGRRYDFMGKCSYYLMKSDEFSIEAENVACAGSISESMGFTLGSTSGLPSCTKSLTINSGSTTLKLKQNREVQLNGEELLQFPVRVAGISIRTISSIFLVVEMPNGVEIWWDGMTRAYIDVPAAFHGKTKGLCGTFNENQNDDFLTPEGDVEQSIEAFANKWKTQEKCQDIKESDVSHPCDENMQNKALAEKHCKKLKGKIFSECHWRVDVEPFYQSCLYDLCSCQGKVGSCLCPIFADYAKDCTLSGVNIDWRHEVRECGIHCLGAQRYQVCGDSCTRSCKDIVHNPNCKSRCVEGCNCPIDQTLDANGTCVAIAECPCMHNDVEYNAGHRDIRPGEDGLELCTCSGAQWKCRKATTEEIREYPKSESLVKECSAVQHLEFTKCEPAEPITCKNMHQPLSAIGTSPAVCRPGCKCKKGYVLDAVSKECILPSKCPCHHGGKSYGEGETMQENCNVCTCNAGSWKCTERICSGVCSSWGDSHFKTFDGKIFDFIGTCDYMLAHGKTSKSDAFEVKIQNVLCGSSGVTCSKSVTVTVGSGNETESVTLTKDKALPFIFGLTRTTVRQAGLFVFIEVTDLGLIVQWDRGTRVYVKIDPKWKNRLKGLCGNYDDNQMDDFQTPSGGVAEVSPTLFGDSWRVQSYCAHAVDIVDTCEIHPTRKTWAMQKCGILKSETFKPCHSEVPVGPYMERCMLDTCGCDLGGDCECLCTAIAAYAQECNIHGVPIKWRTQDICPIQCDETCAHYSPCVSTCPKETCENMFVYKSMTQLCQEDACVEGCQLKACPAGEIYNNLVDLTCVPKSSCRTVCLKIGDKTYFEGDLIKQDGWQSCFCSHHKEVCQGEPSTTTPQKETTPVLEQTTTEMMQQSVCKQGWSQWISNDKPKKIKHNNDVEPLIRTGKLQFRHPLPCHQSEMVDIKCRTVGTHMHYKETGQDVECSLDHGLKCQGTADNPCLDYEISVLCKCTWEVSSTEEVTTPATTTTPKATTPAVVTRPPTSNCVPGWTEWMDSNKPDRNGEFEATELLRQTYSFCPTYMIHDTQCRTVNGHEDAKLMDVQSSCDSKGLSCVNKGRGDMMCQDYEVRFLCSCDCLSGLGMENGDVQNTQISVSSFHTIETLGDQARLNGNGAWIPAETSAKKWTKNWIQVSFNEPKKVTGVDIQGHPVKEAWVKTFTVSVSSDGKAWREITTKDTNWPMVFHGSHDGQTVVRALFPDVYLTQYIRIHPTSFHNSPALRFEVLGCGTEETTPATTAPTTLATTIKPSECEDSEWTQWMNSHTPGPGDWNEFEDYNSLRTKYTFCDSEFITNIRCRSAGTLISIANAGQAGVTCDLNKGLQCSDNLQSPEHCLDYEVSFYCECAKREVDLCPKDAVKKSHETDCHKHYECDKLTGIDVEKNCGEYLMFNPKKQECDWPEDVKKIRPECRGETTETTTEPPVIVSTPTVTSPCDPNNMKTHRVAHETDCNKFYHCEYGTSELRECEPGLIYSVPLMACDSPDTAVPIRSDCKPSTTESTPTTPTTESILRGGAICFPGWTEWFNTTHPDDPDTGGDYELIEDIRAAGNYFCNQKSVTKIQCKYYDDSDSGEEGVKSTKKGSKRVLKNYKESGEVVTCKKHKGLVCDNAAQLNFICQDYAIRLYCDCGQEPETSTTQQTTTTVRTTTQRTTTVSHDEMTTMSQCPPGQIWQDCAMQCDQVCLFYNYELRLHGFCDSQAGCKSGCVNEHVWYQCNQPGYKYVAHDKCVREIDCPCISNDGQIVPPGKVHIENGCERCQCLNNRYTCDKSACFTTTPQVEEESTTMEIFTETPRTMPTLGVGNHENCRSGWTPWNSESTPTGQNDEIESLSFLHKNCSPVAIECRTVRDQLNFRQTGQVVSCQMSSGLKCFDHNNFPEGCMNYEIRVNCDCGEPTTVTVTTPTTSIPEVTTSAPEETPEVTTGMSVVTTPVACDGWSKWYNEGNPDADGLDKEGKMTYELLKEGFCQNGHVTDIDCVNAENGLTYTTTDDKEVTCSLDDGLVCYNVDQDDSKCSDYKVRYYCSCGKVETTTTIIVTTIPTASPPPYCDENNFVNLVNGLVPLADTAFKASSSKSAAFSPHHARIVPSKKLLRTGNVPSWVAGEDDPKQFLQIDLGRVEPVYGVAVQGNELTKKHVTSYNVQYSTNGQLYTYVTDMDRNTKVFRGPIDNSESSKQVFEIPFEGRYIRFIPLTWKNGIAMGVEIFGCKHTEETSVYTPTTSTFYSTSMDVEILCDEPMGIENGLLNDQYIEVSSILNDDKDENGPKNIKINGPSAWRPDFFDSHPWVLVDLTGPRNISGIITQGDEKKDAWVESYKIAYSNDKEHWNPVLDKYRVEKTFPGNYDSTTESKNVFDKMIHAQYLKIIPQQWHTAVGFKVEVIGCYHPYPELPPVTTTEPPPDEVKECTSICPKLPEEKMVDCKQCEEGKAWNGEECVYRADCSCYVGHIEYPVGTIYEREDCHKCTCKLGGIAECEPQVCKKCEDNMQSVSTAQCGCVCKPCAEGTRLCPTSNVCVNESVWCDGVQDCPDDELECTTTTVVTTAATEASTPASPPECPTVPPCADGYVLVQKPPKQRNDFTKKKSASRRRNPQRTVLCPEYHCVQVHTPPPTPSTPCPTPNCPPGYDVIKKDVGATCPAFRCHLPPKEEVCKIEGRNFKTFDNTHYQYDICHHIIAQDKVNKEWQITVEKICTETNECKEHLTIKQGDYKLKIRPDLSIEYNGYTYTIEQAQTIGSQHQEFLISRLGNSVLFESNHYGFRVTFDQKRHISVEVPSKLIGQVNGLCGLYNGIEEDDKSKPDDNLARSSQEFGDSWAMPGTQNDCLEKTCAQQFQSKAVEICTEISKKSPLDLCKDVVAVEHFVSACIESVCNCLEHSKNDEECRCEATLDFMMQCQEKSSELDLSSWRVQYNCPAECPPGLVFKDCFKNKCELTCDTLHVKTPCPVLENTCFSGCYCPDGLVRKGEKCVRPGECRDCVCNGFGDPQYITFDRTNYTFNGNCTYVASRDIAPNKKKHTYQVLATNVECIEEPGTTCTDAITVLYNGHGIHVGRVEGEKKILTYLDGKLITTFPYVNDWLRIEKMPTKSVTIHIQEIQLEVTYLYFNYAFVVRLPSQIFCNKTEGLCGNCNKDKSDDLKTKDGVITDDIDEFGLSWLVKDLPPGMKVEENCLAPPKNECLPLPPNEDPCLWIMDEDKFGKCHPIVDPVSYIVACQFDVCHALDRVKTACRDVQAYAQECQSHGLCLDWRSDGLCNYDCPTGMEYKACSSGCVETCENYEQLREDPSSCDLEITEGCHCPRGQVFKNDKCIKDTHCKVCDDEGHVIGDEWLTDQNCTTCSCIAQKAAEKPAIRCVKKICPGKKICELGYKLITKAGTEHDCCPEYDCEREECPVTNVPNCGPYQEVKEVKTNEACPTLICQCIPVEDCPNVETNIGLEPVLPNLNLGPSGDFVVAPQSDVGMVRHVNNSGCCPHVTEICDKTTCPKLKCEPFHKVEVVVGTESLCCPIQNCLPPTDACLYDHKFIASDKGGERLRTNEEKKTELKQIGSQWNDGPCNLCECVPGGAIGETPISDCSRKLCLTEEQMPDFKDYVLEEQSKIGECCSSFIRKSCKVDGGQYEVGEEWPIEDDKCSTGICVQVDGGVVQKQTKTEKCSTDCERGWEYEPAAEDSPKCCGQCKQVECIVDDVSHVAGSNWHSEDTCTQYFCVQTMNGTLQVEANRKSCPQIPAEELENFVVKSFTLPGECCNSSERVACIHDGVRHEIGDVWPSPIDKCKKFSCSRSDKGEIIKQEQLETCRLNCDKGWVYVNASEESDKCCGHCVQEFCIFGNELKKKGEQWTSEDNCTTSYCEPVNNEVQLQVNNATKMCPPLTACKPGTIRLAPEGCCEICDPEGANLKECDSAIVEDAETVGIVTEHHGVHGLCTNRQVIPNFRECNGYCHSTTHYSSYSASHVSDCKCCQPQEFETINVEVECEDDYKYTKAIKVPKMCTCTVCHDEGKGKKSGVKGAKVPRKANPDISRLFEGFEAQ